MRCWRCCGWRPTQCRLGCEASLWAPSLLGSRCRRCVNLHVYDYAACVSPFRCMYVLCWAALLYCRPCTLAVPILRPSGCGCGRCTRPAPLAFLPILMHCPTLHLNDVSLVDASAASLQAARAAASPVHRPARCRGQQRRHCLLVEVDCSVRAGPRSPSLCDQCAHVAATNGPQGSQGAAARC